MKHLIVTALFAATISTNALAWGDREQGALAGIVIGSMIRGSSQQQPQSPPVVIYTQPQQQICGYNTYCGPISCFQQPIWDQYGRVIGYQTVCR